jgi:ATPase family associated with various cellular activities (AAA)
MPTDIVGTRIWRPSTESFDIELGPIFGDLILADEINRAPANVQSALLEAMAEHQVSIGGTSRPRCSVTGSCSRSICRSPTSWRRWRFSHGWARDRPGPEAGSIGIGFAAAIDRAAAVARQIIAND